MRPRPRHLLPLAVVVGLLPVAALAARAIVDVKPPPMSSCVGDHLWFGEQDDAQLAPAPGFRIEVYGPRGGKVWEKVWDAGQQVRFWPHAYRPTRPGTYRVAFVNGRARKLFDVRVVYCRGVGIELNDRGRALLSLRNAKPGSAAVSCLLVTYTGASKALVRLYGRTRTTGLDRFLRLTVVRGSFAAVPRQRSCAGFTPDAQNYRGEGRGVVYRGSLRRFADSYAAATPDPPGTFRMWRSGESHAYKLVVALEDRNAAQGLQATQTFTWEARARPAREGS